MNLYKYYYLYLLLFIFNCHVSQQESLGQLELALVNWYYKYNPTISSYHGINQYDSQLEKFNLNFIEEYKADINRFIIELSQIDESDLNQKHLIDYSIINEFLHDLYNKSYNLNYNSYSPNYFLNIIYDSLFLIIYNNNLDMDSKVDSIVKRLKLIQLSISEIKTSLIYYSKYEIDKSTQLILMINQLLDNLPLSINSDINTLDLIDKIIAEIKNELHGLQGYMNSNITKSNKIDKQSIVSKQLLHNSENYIATDYSYNIKNTQLDMFNIALPIYLKNNDEPVWVDREDTLKVINYVLQGLYDKFPGKDEIISTLNTSINNIDIFFKNIPGFKNAMNYDYEIIINNDIYLDQNQLYRFLWNNNNETLFFLNNSPYYNNKNLLQLFNKYKLDLYNMSNSFPGNYWQSTQLKDDEFLITDIAVNNYTRYGWGLFSQYIAVDNGYGEDENNYYTLTHFYNVINSVMRIMIFNDYYINEKDKDEILSELYNLTFYDMHEIENIFYDVTDNLFLESNFEAIGYLRLKELYKKYISIPKYDKSKFYSTLLEHSHIDLSLIKQFKLNLND